MTKHQISTYIFHLSLSEHPFCIPPPPLPSIPIRFVHGPTLYPLLFSILPSTPPKNSQPITFIPPLHFGHPQNSPFLSSRLPTFPNTYHTTMTIALAIMQAPEYAMMFSYLPIPYTFVRTSVVRRAALTGPVSRLPTPFMQAKVERAGRARAGLGERVVLW